MMAPSKVHRFVAILISAGVCEVGVAQQLRVHNISHDKVQAIEGDEKAQGRTIETGTTVDFDCYGKAGIPWFFKSGTGFRAIDLGRHVVKDADRDAVYVTDRGVFSPGDIVLIRLADFEHHVTNVGEFSWVAGASHPSTCFIVRESKTGEGISFVPLAGDSKAPQRNETWNRNNIWTLHPHPIISQAALILLADTGKLKLGRGRAVDSPSFLELVPVGAAVSSGFSVQREIDHWLSENQPSMGQKSQGKITSKSITDSFAGELVIKDEDCRRGYNVLRMNPMNLEEKGVTAASPDLLEEYHPDAGNTYYLQGGYRVPKNLMWTDANVASSTASEAMYSSRSSATKGMSVSVGVSVEGKGSANASYESSHSKMDDNQTFLKIGMKSGHRMWLSLDKELLQLDPKLREFLRTMPVEKYDGTLQRPGFKQLFETYGTHYALSTLFGARAWLEEEFTKEAIAEEASEQVGAGLTVGGVGVETSFTDKTVQEDSSSSRKTRFRRSGGTSTNFEAFSIGEAKDWVPIKVDLHPLGELLRAELCRDCSPEFAAHLTSHRMAFPAMLNRYIVEESRVVESVGQREPMVFEMQFNHAKCTKSDDAVGQPEIYGGMTMGVFRKGDPVEYIGKPRPLKLSRLWSADDNNTDADGTISKADVEAQQPKSADEDQDPIKGQSSITFALLPELKRTTLGRRQVVSATFPLDEYFFALNYGLYDWDEGANPDERMAGWSPEVSLRDIAKAPTAGYVFKFTQEVADFGTMEFQCTLRRVNYHFESTPDSLPPAPKFR